MAANCLAASGLDDHFDLSFITSQRIRISVARAIVQRPTIILLDEATAGVPTL
jgi:ABC-type Na+ transport system ATPase subunit NatA